jgi:hypothetical protein
MKKALKILVFLLTAATAANAQVAPAATMGAARLTYTFRYSELAVFGGSYGDRQTITPSATVAFASGEERHPFNLKYAGGYTWSIAGASYGTGLFQRLSLSQGFVWRKWNILVSDNVSYTPQSPITGFSGIPGIGEPIGEPNPSPPSSQSILTANTHVVNNNAMGEFERGLTASTSLSAGGGSDILRYPDGNGLETNSLMANAALAWRQNARNSFSGTYRFTQYSYSGYSVTFMSNTALFSYRRNWNRRLTTSVGAGPEWIGSNDSSVVPSSTLISANAAIDYALRFGAAGLHYSRGTNGGAGYLLGAESDSVTADFSRELGRTVTLGFTGAYRRTAGLNRNGVTNSKDAGAQATWRLGRYVTAFAGYTAIQQSSSSPLASTALSGLENMINFGIGYSPRGTRLVRH